MANEFKVRKGLIVEGSGSAILDIQGSQGQLFSITDDLTGDVFSVSDISGVPILNVNADGTTTVTGEISSSVGIRSEGIIRAAGAVMGMESILSRDVTIGRELRFDATPVNSSEATSLMINTSGTVVTRELGSNAFNSTGFTTNTGTLTGNGSAGRVPIYNGTTSFTTDPSFTYSSNKLSIDGTLTSNGVDTFSNEANAQVLLIGDTTLGDTMEQIDFNVMGTTMIRMDDNNVIVNSLQLGAIDETTSDTKALFIDGNAVVKYRPLGSSAFTATTTADGNYGLYMSGTTVRMENDRRRNSTSTDVYTGNTHDFTWFDQDVGIRWYTAGAEEMRLENDGDLHVDGDIIAFSSTVSDERLKDNVTTIENPLDKIKALRGVEYDWNDGSRKGKHDLGLIAQEVEKVLPNIVHEYQMPLLNDDEEDETLYKTVDYEKMVAVLIEGMKEQQSQIDELKSELAKIKGSL